MKLQFRYCIGNVLLYPLILSIGFSCKKFVEIEPAPNLIETKALFSNDKTAIAAVYGIYSQIRSYNLGMNNGGLSLYCGLSADELFYTGSLANVDQFLQNSLTSDNTYVNTNFWTQAYKSIYQANALINGLQHYSGITDSVKKQLLGELKVIRSLNYFNLINLFGPVPLILTPDYQFNAVMPRNPVQEVYQQLLTDLIEAQSLLKNAYPSAGKLRINKSMATALLARVYLFMEKWQEAELQASSVIDSGLYGLVPGLNNVFLINSPETIWEMGVDIANTAEGGTFVPSSATARPVYPLTAKLVNLFEAGDLRKAAWTKVNTVSGQQYPYAYKYKVRTIVMPVTEYTVALRLAELYLIRSEARARLNNVAGSQQDLNKIRNRAGLPDTPADDQPSLLLAIEKERQTELFCEWGHRWFDLKRTGRANAVLSSYKGTSWQPEDVLYPIPLNELETNVFLTQNLGYRLLPSGSVK
jgi:hypothetical protein